MAFPHMKGYVFDDVLIMPLKSKTHSFVRAPEGESERIPFKGKVADIVAILLAGLRQTMAYTNSPTIADFHKNALFVEVSNAGREESRAHGFDR